MTTANPPAAEAAADPALPTPELRHLGLRIVLIVVAAIELAFAMMDVKLLMDDMSWISPGIGGGLIKAHLFAHPVLAFAAIIFALMGLVRYAIIALGVIAIMTWLSDMPGVVAHGLELWSLFAAIETVSKVIAFPLMAACAIAYAAHNEHPGRATLLVSIPALFKFVMVGGFAIGVMIYGF